MNKYPRLVLLALWMLTMTGCSTGTVMTAVPAPIVTVTTTITPATTMPTPPPASMTQPSPTCVTTVKGLPVGACSTSNYTAEQVLAACSRARDAWAGQVVGLSTVVDPADARLCASSVSLSGDGALIKGLPDQRALPAGWPASDTKAWYIGSFKITALNLTGTKHETFYYFADGRPMTAGQIAIFDVNLVRFEKLR